MSEQNQKAITFARKNKKKIAIEILEGLTPSRYPFSIFMAGSPGAGKTELARQLVKEFEKEKIIHLDGDGLRSKLPEYSGDNSHRFQAAISILVDCIHDELLKKQISFILDGTLAEEAIAVKNIKRSLKRNRKVIIIYIIQEPILSWKFTLAREKKEGRRITKEVFIDRYIKSHQTVSKVLDNFDSRVEVTIVQKNFATQEVDAIHSLKAGESSIDEYVPKVYNQEELERML